MAAKLKVGNFQLNTSTGNQSITGLGFTPKAIIMFTAPNTNAIDSPDWTANYYQSIGFSDGSQSYATWAHSPHGSSGAETASFAQSEYCLLGGANASSMFYASMVSLDSDGFTINVVAAPGVGYWVGYIAIGGDDVSAKVGTFDTSGSTGTQAVTGMGFQPSAILFNGLFRDTAFYVSGTAGSGLAVPNIGVSNAVNNYGVSNYLRSSGVSTKIRSAVQSDLYSLLAATNSYAYRGHVDSFDADGFTVDWTTLSLANRKIFYLALEGVAIDIGVFDLPTSTGDFTPTSTAPFKPGGLLMLTSGQSVLDTIQGGGATAGGPGAEYSYGIATASDEVFMLAAWAQDFIGTSNEHHRTHDVHALALANLSTTTTEEADFKEFLATGFVLTSTVVVGSSPAKVGYVLFESDETDPPTEPPSGGSGGEHSPDSSFLFNVI